MKIMLIEDNLADRLLTQEAFKRSCAGSELHCVEDGQLALAYLSDLSEDELPQVILSDMHLPDKTGHEILSEVKNFPQLSQIPFVILSSSSSQREINRSKELGASAHVLKPSSMTAFFSFAEVVFMAAKNVPFSIEEAEKRQKQKQLASI